MTPSIFRIAVFIFLFTPLCSWGKWECRDKISFKYVHQKIQKSLVQSICRRSDKPMFWVNQKCYKHRGKCNRRLRKLSKAVVQKKQQFGNPYFQKCHLMGGDAILVKYLWDKAWIDSSLCRFKNGDIVSISFLP